MMVGWLRPSSNFKKKRTSLKIRVRVSSRVDLQQRALKASVLVKGREMGLGLKQPPLVESDWTRLGAGGGCTPAISTRTQGKSPLSACGYGWSNLCTLITQRATGVQPHPAPDFNQTRPGEAA